MAYTVGIILVLTSINLSLEEGEKGREGGDGREGRKEITYEGSCCGIGCIIVYVINLTLQGRRRESGAKTEIIHYN